MSFAETALLGAIAGITIYLGLPVGRVRRIDDRVRVGLAMFSAGILAFIFMDVTTHAQSIIASTLHQFKNGHASFGHVVWLFALLAVGFVAGTAGIAGVERRLKRPQRASAPQIAGAAVGTITAEDSALIHAEAAMLRANALRTAMTIAVAIGLHNFAEGLAIGVSARAGAIGLATVLIVGFALHNATEGFGIVAPLTGETTPDGARVIPSWGSLLLLGAIGGGPTFIGTAVGHAFTAEWVSVVFLTLAAGSILYVVIQLVGIAAKSKRMDLLAYGLLIGIIAGFATDAIVTAAGV